MTAPVEARPAVDRDVVAVDVDVARRAPRSPAAIPASRSDSLWRSSPAPRIVVVPRACVAARQRIGISSIAAATSAGPRSMAAQLARADDEVGQRLARVVVGAVAGRAARPALLDRRAHARAGGR